MELATIAFDAAFIYLTWSHVRYHGLKTMLPIFAGAIIFVCLMMLFLPASVTPAVASAFTVNWATATWAWLTAIATAQHYDTLRHHNAMMEHYRTFIQSLKDRGMT